MGLIDQLAWAVPTPAALRLPAFTRRSVFKSDLSGNDHALQARQLRAMTVVVADTGDIEAVRA